MSTGPRFRIDPERAEWRRAANRVIVTDLTTGALFELAGSGAVIWQALGDGATLADLVAALTAEFDVDAPTASADTERFLTSLAEHRLLVRHDD